MRSVLIALLLLPVSSFGQTTVLRVVDVYPTLAAGFQRDYADPLAYPHAPLFEPTVFAMPGGEVGMMAQGGCLGVPQLDPAGLITWGEGGDIKFSDSGFAQRCPGNTYFVDATPQNPRGVERPDSDSLFFFKRLPSGTWVDGTHPQTPMSDVHSATWPFYSPFALANQHNSCSRYHLTTTGFEYVDGVYGGPAVISDGDSLYMAYLKGNGDGWAGEIWWATSRDKGVTWQEEPAPLMYGYYHSRFGRFAVTHTTLGVEIEGFVAVASTLVTHPDGQRWIYLYAMYAHASREKGGGRTTYSSITFRIAYDPTSANGLSTKRELWQHGEWFPHDGRFAWLDATYGLTYCPDHDFDDVPKVDAVAVNSTWGSGDLNNLWPQSVTYDGTHFVMLVDPIFVDRTNVTPLQFKVSDNGTDWCGPFNIDVTAIAASPNATGPHHTAGETTFNNSLWYGELDNVDGRARRGYWGFFSLKDFADKPNDMRCAPGAIGLSECAHPYNGTRILPVRIELAPDAVMPSCPEPDCALQVAPATSVSQPLSVSAAGRDGLIRVTQRCRWSATSNSDFITISRSGNNAIKYTVQPNDGPARSGTITIQDQTFYIAQGACRACTIDKRRGD